MEQVVREMGLSKNEIKVYLTLLKLGSANVGDITKKSGVHRRNVYDCLERLMKKGVVGYVTKHRTKYFEASPPRRLLELVREEREKLKEKEAKILTVVSKLSGVYGLARNEERFVTIYHGVEGMKLVFNDIVKTAKENLVLGAHTPPKEIRGFLNSFHKKRIKAGVRERFLFAADSEEWAAHLKRMPFTSVRFLPGNIKSRAAVNIYADKVAIFMWSEPTTILIKNEEVADAFREYFNLLWKLGRRKA